MSAIRKFNTQFKLALKSIQNAPGFSASVIITMSLSLAMVFVIFALVNTYFIRPLNVLDENKLYVVEQEVDAASGTHSGYQSYKAIDHWIKTQNSFEKVAAISASDFIVKNLAGEPKVVATYASPDYYDIFKVPMILGNAFSPNLKVDEASDNVIISERLWKQYFDADPNVIGQKIMPMDAEIQSAFSIIGVISDDFESPYMFYQGKTDLWFTFGSDVRFYNNGRWDNPWDNTYGYLKIVGSSKKGMILSSIYKDFDDSIESIRPEWLEGYPTSTDIRPLLTKYRTVELGDKGHLSLLLLAGTVGLLLIAIVNVSSLFFSRALSQHKHLALQSVLGAKPKLLFFSIFLQTFILMFISVLLALFFSAWGVKIFKHLAFEKLPLVQSIAIDMNLLTVAVLCCFCLSLLFAFVTSSLINYKALRSQIQTSGKGGVTQVSSRTTRSLICAQMFLGSLLIIFSCLVLTKSQHTLTREMGSKITNMFSVGAFIPGERERTSHSERHEKRLEIQKILAKLPEVKSVSIGNSPVQQSVSAASLFDMQGNATKFFPQSWVGADYFKHSGLKIIQGRTFSEQAMRGEVYEMLVSKAVAFQLDPNGNVLGKVYRGQQQDYTIVGVTENFNHPEYYHRDEGAHIWWASIPFAYTYIVETHENNIITKQDMLVFFKDIQPDFNLWNFLSIEDEYNRIIYMDRITLYMSYLLCGFTLLLASVGIYGVLSYNMGLRRNEFGIRMALGAKKKTLYKLLLSAAILPISVGLLLAVLTALIIYQNYSENLMLWLNYDIYLAAPAVLLTFAIAIFAGFRPMQLIIKQQPMRALRND